MAAFSIFESFFFLMLATTFVLILLLVYHFKNRITSMEEKNDKLFSIIRSLAEELNSLKDNPYPLNMHPLNVTTNFDSKTNEHSDKFINLNEIDHSNLVDNIDLDDFDDEDDEDDDEINTEDLDEEFDDEIDMIQRTCKSSIENFGYRSISFEQYRNLKIKSKEERIRLKTLIDE